MFVSNALQTRTKTIKSDETQTTGKKIFILVNGVKRPVKAVDRHFLSQSLIRRQHAHMCMVGM